jgi:pimeloyl-ACP methyl ester carboxylesterase
MTDARKIRRAYVDVPGGQMHCHMVEGVQPAILFLHQTACSAASYDRLLVELALPNQLVAIDTAGFGGSFDPEGWPTLDAYAADILATADGLGIDEFHVFGHHTGATLAIEIAARHPDRVRSIMLAGPVFMTDEEKASFDRDYRVPIAPQRDGSHLMKNWMYAAGFNPDCDVELLHGEVVAMLRAWKARPQAYSAVAHHDTAGAMAQVACPVLLLTSPDDFFHESFGRATGLAPGAVIVETGGGNFQPGADAPGVARAVEAFLREG